MSRSQAPEKAPSVPPLCQAVKTTRQGYQESQASFAQRVGLSAMTVSKFERGETVPRDPAVLQALSRAAKEANLNAEAEQFAMACREALNIEAVNRMYPGRSIAAVQPVVPPQVQQNIGTAVAFQTVPEWRLLMIALSAARYDSKTAEALEAAGGPVRAIVDEVLQDADVSSGIGPDFYRASEEHIKTRMAALFLKRVAKGDQEER